MNSHWGQRFIRFRNCRRVLKSEGLDLSIIKSKGECDLEGMVVTGWLRGRQNLNGFFSNLPVFFTNDPILESFS